MIKWLCFKLWKPLLYCKQTKWACIFSFDRDILMIWKSLCDIIKTFNFKTGLWKALPDLWLKGDWGKTLTFLTLRELKIVQPSDCHRRIIGMQVVFRGCYELFTIRDFLAFTPAIFVFSFTSKSPFLIVCSLGSAVFDNVFLCKSSENLFDDDNAPHSAQLYLFQGRSLLVLSL